MDSCTVAAGCGRRNGASAGRDSRGHLIFRHHHFGAAGLAAVRHHPADAAAHRPWQSAHGLAAAAAAGVHHPVERLQVGGIAGASQGGRLLPIQGGRHSPDFVGTGEQTPRPQPRFAERAGLFRPRFICHLRFQLLDGAMDGARCGAGRRKAADKNFGPDGLGLAGHRHDPGGAGD